jgi:hypothetical protein
MFSNRIQINFNMISEFETFDSTSYYSGYCKSSLWPLLHYRLQNVKHKENSWEAYVKVNKIFAETILSHCKAGKNIVSKKETIKRMNDKGTNFALIATNRLQCENCVH